MYIISGIYLYSLNFKVHFAIIRTNSKTQMARHSYMPPTANRSDLAELPSSWSWTDLTGHCAYKDCCRWMPDSSTFGDVWSTPLNVLFNKNLLGPTYSNWCDGEAIEITSKTICGKLHCCLVTALKKCKKDSLRFYSNLKAQSMKTHYELTAFSVQVD